MYSVGDKIVYPLHGAGIIEAIEEKTVLGKKKKYYVMRIQSGKMTVLIPTDKCEEIGIRDVIDASEAKKVLEHFREQAVWNDENWNRRQRDNMKKIHTGDLYQVLDVMKNLMYRELSKGLSTSERKILASTKQMVISELVMSGYADEEDIEMILSETVRALLPEKKD